MKEFSKIDSLQFEIKSRDGIISDLRAAEEKLQCDLVINLALLFLTNNSHDILRQQNLTSYSNYKANSMSLVVSAVSFEKNITFFRFPYHFRLSPFFHCFCVLENILLRRMQNSSTVLCWKTSANRLRQCQLDWRS